MREALVSVVDLLPIAVSVEYLCMERHIVRLAPPIRNPCRKPSIFLGGMLAIAAQPVKPSRASQPLCGNGVVYRVGSCAIAVIDLDGSWSQRQRSVHLVSWVRCLAGPEDVQQPLQTHRISSADPAPLERREPPHDLVSLEYLVFGAIAEIVEQIGKHDDVLPPEENIAVADSCLHARCTFLNDPRPEPPRLRKETLDGGMNCWIKQAAICRVELLSCLDDKRSQMILAGEVVRVMCDREMR